MLFIGQCGLLSDDIFQMLGLHFKEMCFVREPFAESNGLRRELIIWHAPKIHPQQLAKLRRGYNEVPILLITDSVFKTLENTVCFDAPISTVVHVVEALSGEAIKTQHSPYNLKEELILHNVEKSNKELARFYDVSISDIKYHKRKLYQKLGVTSKREAMLLKP